jgi:hypothetical protein
MPCCTGHCAAVNHFDPDVAKRDLRRYQRQGPDVSTRLLLSELRRWPLQGLHLASRDSSRPAQFILGDFAATAASVPDADIVTLDRVVCCYPDVESLLRGAADRARRMVAFTYHPDRWYLHAAVALENSWYRLKQNPFRAFVHSPNRMAAVLESAGLVRAAARPPPNGPSTSTDALPSPSFAHFASSPSQMALRSKRNMIF